MMSVDGRYTTVPVHRGGTKGPFLSPGGPGLPYPLPCISRFTRYSENSPNARNAPSSQNTLTPIRQSDVPKSRKSIRLHREEM